MAARFDDDFKRAVVGVAQTSGLIQRQVAADFVIGLSRLGKWLVKFGDQTVMSQSQLDLLKEIERLRKENRLLKEERDVLEKAAMFFAEQSK